MVTSGGCHMKMRIAVVVALGFLLSVALLVSACGSDPEETTTTASPSSGPEGGGTTTTEGATQGGGASEPAEDFPTDDITWIIPYSPGGGFDTYSRGVARLLPKHLPGNVNVIPENIEGAGGRRGTATLYRADPDGHTIGIINVPGAIVTELLQDTEYN